MFDFINELSESKLFPSSQVLDKATIQDIRDGAHMTICSVIILLDDEANHDAMVSYCKKTCRLTTYEKWRTDSTDLYLFLHGLVSRDDAHLTKIKTWIKAKGDKQSTQTRRLLTDLDSVLHVKNSTLQSVRRRVMDWKTTSNDQKVDTIEKLLHQLNLKDKKFDLLDKLKALKSRLEALTEDTCGGTSSASIATVTKSEVARGSIGAGFAPSEQWRSVYSKTKVAKKPKK